MYNDYDVVYKSNINEYFILWMIFGVIAFVLLVFTLFSLSKIFKKASMSGVSAWIPIYNIYTLVEVANLDSIYTLLLFIPFVNLYFYFKLCMAMAKVFKKKESFAFVLFFLPFIGFPILAFGSYDYFGINLIGKESKNMIKDIPVIDETKNKEIEVEVNDQEDVASRNINISLGGGVYQKDYAKNLETVSKDKMLDIKPKQDQPKPDLLKGNFINDETFSQIAKAETANNTTSTNTVPAGGDLFSVPFIGDQMTTQNVEEPPKSVNIIGGVEVSARSEAITPEKPVPSANGEYSVCPNCGTRVGENNKMCFICGQPLK